MHGFLHLYRERDGDPAFWAEPVNALTNLSFLLAALAAWSLAKSRGALTEATWLLISLAAAIGIGSFLFHTCANSVTMWLDIIPIALFQVAFLWLAGRYMIRMSAVGAAAVLVGVVGLSFALMPLHEPFNGSLFYAPVLLAIYGYAWALHRRQSEERWLLPTAAAVFTCSVTARSIDWLVPWSLGTHFIWHSFNGLVLYFAMRSWIVHVAPRVQVCDIQAG